MSNSLLSTVIKAVENGEEIFHFTESELVGSAIICTGIGFMFGLSLGLAFSSCSSSNSNVHVDRYGVSINGRRY